MSKSTFRVAAMQQNAFSLGNNCLPRANQILTVPVIPVLKVVYDIRTAFFWRLYGDFGDQVFMVLFPLAVIVGGWYSSRKSETRCERLIGNVVLGASFAVFGVMGWEKYSATERLRGDLNSGRAVEVTGRVSDFVTGNSGGRPPETFRIDSTHFEVSWFRGSAGYQLIEREGGVIHSGDSVRISHVGSAIVRIETLP